MSRGDTPSALRPAITSEREVPSGTSARVDAGILVQVGLRARNHHAVAFRKRVGLHHKRRFLDAQGQVALRDGDPGNADILSHDDRAGTLIDHDAGLALGLDADVLDPPKSMRGRAHAGARQVEPYRAGIQHDSDVSPDSPVDFTFNAGGGREIRARAMPA